MSDFHVRPIVLWDKSAEYGMLRFRWAFTFYNTWFCIIDVNRLYFEKWNEINLLLKGKFKSTTDWQNSSVLLSYFIKNQSILFLFQGLDFSLEWQRTSGMRRLVESYQRFFCRKCSSIYRNKSRYFFVNSSFFSSTKAYLTRSNQKKSILSSTSFSVFFPWFKTT